MWKNILLVAVGGATGSVLRYLSSVFLSKYVVSSFPWATFLVNIVGCFVVGLVLGIFARGEDDVSALRLLLLTGFCGGYTTFSAFALENVQLLQSGQTVAAITYVIGSVLMGLLAVWFGWAILR